MLFASSPKFAASFIVLALTIQTLELHTNVSIVSFNLINKITAIIISKLYEQASSSP